MPIRWRIVLPLAGLFLLSYGVLAVVSTLMVASAAEERIVGQTRDLATFVVQMQGVHPQAIQHIKSATGAEVIAVTPEGLAPGLSTPKPSVLDGFRKRLAAGSLEDGAEVGPHLIIRAPVSGNTLYLLYPAGVLQEKKLEAAGPLIVLSGLGLMAVIIVGFLVARGIARPIEELASHARNVVDLKAEHPLEAKGGSIETRHLVEALNRMLTTLREAQERLVDAQRAKVIREMAGSVAHEIKNPLQAIQMIVQTSDTLPDSDKKMLINEIRRVELASLELLSLAGPGKLNREETSLGSIVEGTLDLLSRSLEHLNVRVTKQVAPNGSASLDRDRIQRAVMNLVLNGAQAMPTGGELRVESGPAESGWSRVAVTDHGPGIPEDVRGRIFEPFVTTKQDGVGIGLFVTKTIIEQHGGRVGYDSSPGKTTFYFEVPSKPSS